MVRSFRAQAIATRGAMANIKPAVAIPIHYATWPLLVSDISAFKRAAVEVRPMKPGESWTCG